MTKPPAWKDRLNEARQLMVFSPTPSGAKPYATTLEHLAETLDLVEVTGSIGQADSPTDVLARAVSMILRELINARMFERNMAARLEVGPDRVDELDAKVDGIYQKIEVVIGGLSVLMKNTAGK